MNRQERYSRDWLLKQHLHNPEQVISVTGYLQLNPKKPNWVTFTQVENNEGVRIAGHINLPSIKAEKLYPSIQSKGRKKFVITGKPSYYISKGTKRGSLLVTQIQYVK